MESVYCHSLAHSGRVQGSINWADVLHSPLGSDESARNWEDGRFLCCDCEPNVTEQNLAILRGTHVVALVHFGQGRRLQRLLDSLLHQRVKEARLLVGRPGGDVGVGFGTSTRVVRYPALRQGLRRFRERAVENRLLERQTTVLRLSVVLWLWLRVVFCLALT